MLFNTIPYVIFLPIVVLLYYLIPHRFRWVLLLAVSYFFYMCWKPEYLILIVASTLVDYVAAIMMEKYDRSAKRRIFLILSLTVNLGLLFFFKYHNFFAESVNSFFYKIGFEMRMEYLEFLLPVGISFYTFQTLSYSIDVYKGRCKAEKHLGIFALYVSFFPQLVAGPIERFTRLAPQFRAKHKITYRNISNGLRLILFGLFIKMVIADNLSVFVDQIYSNPLSYSSFDVATGLFFYSFQIYSDFFGYSTIAIGSALLLGIKIMDNFNSPYLSKNIGEFWQRWHISLSTWFRDYLYFPLGGNKGSKLRWGFNILIVFVVSGLWHGANWTFLFWGLFFGVVYLIEKGLNKLFSFERTYRKFSVGHLLLGLKTFILVTLAWVFFRSVQLSDSIDVFKSLGNGKTPENHLSIPLFIWIFLGLFIISDFIFYDNRFDKRLSKMNSVFRWTIYSCLIFAILVFAGIENFPFIYFQF